jgi:hypothetical protein
LYNERDAKKKQQQQPTTKKKKPPPKKNPNKAPAPIKATPNAPTQKGNFKHFFNCFAKNLC